ncbi:MAG: NF038104 family lipoprotein [Mariprofundus sp.]|nr:NF038104 family lipoprotein [Mariprofundus sp.]
MKKIFVSFMLIFALNGCIATAVSTAVDVGIEVIKVPFKVGGAIYDGVTGDDDEAAAAAGKQEDDKKE